MKTTKGKKTDHQDALGRLVRDLEEKPRLCAVNDYPGATLAQLNEYVAEHGPIVNPVFGEQPAFFIDEGHFTPYRMVVYNNEKVAAKTAELLGEWAKWSREGGRVTTSQGAFVLEQHPRKPTVRMPDVAYTPRDEDRGLDHAQMWTYRGEPFVPSFVVEIDKLSGRGSQRRALNRKMRYEYFRHGVQLGWLIDPRPGYYKMYEYYLNERGQVKCSDDTAWRDLDGRDVLPGFTLTSTDLEMVLDQDPGSSEEEEVDFACPERGCGKRMRSRGTWTAHAERHRAECARQKHLAKRARS